MSALSKTNKYLFRYKYHLLFGALFVCIANIFQIVPAQVVRTTFDLVAETIKLHGMYNGTANKSGIYDMFINSLVIYGLVIVGMALLRGFFMFLMRQTIIVMSRHIEYDQKNDIYEHYQSLPVSFYRKNNTGDLMARISEDVSKVRMYFGPAIMYGMNLISTVILVVPIMFSINAKLTLWALIPLPILSITIYYVNNLIEKKSLEIQRSLSALSTFVQEAFSGIRVIKAFARENDSLRNYEIKTETYKSKSLELAQVNSVFAPAMMAMVGMSVLIIIYVGGNEVIAGNITAGNIAEFIMYVTMLTWPFTALGWVSSIIQRAEASQQRINEFLDVKTDIVSERNLINEITGTIKFENVTLVYPESGIKALDNVTFEVEQGQSLAILGTTGSGKSTIANLMCRLMDVTDGQILIDGVNIKDFEIFHLRNQIGYVPQDVFLFSDTIENNIAFGSLKISEEKIIQSAKDADLYDNISSFKDGLQTRVGERGITLSGGQKQRLSIARALARDPKLLILDDCLSAVDTHTENNILNSLEALMIGKTSIIISHRVSSAKLANYIIMLDEGKVIERGTHHELYNSKSKYRELFDKQMQAEEVDS
ncbi:MAG: ABC transporter ATP-binding protein [Bacteroidota bacterium]|nr:ABC transporter ATP-binding protein [Bacteroidota bacterium]